MQVVQATYGPVGYATVATYSPEPSVVVAFVVVVKVSSRNRRPLSGRFPTDKVMYLFTHSLTHWISLEVLTGRFGDEFVPVSSADCKKPISKVKVKPRLCRHLTHHLLNIASSPIQAMPHKPHFFLVNGWLEKIRPIAAFSDSQNCA